MNVYRASGCCFGFSEALSSVWDVLFTRAALAGVVGLGSKAVSVAKGAGGVGEHYFH